MPKQFNNIIKQTNKKAYSKASMMFIMLAKLNSCYAFNRILAPDGSDDLSLSAKYTAQRKLRPLPPKEVADANSGSTSSALAVLDQFQKSEWETLPIVTGKLKVMGFKGTFNDDFNLDSLTPIHADDATRQANEIAIDRKGTMFAKIYSSAHVSKATYDITKSDRTTTETITVPELEVFVNGEAKVWNSIASALIAFNRIDDKHATESDPEDTVVAVSPEKALNLTTEMGTVFNQEAPISQTGFTTGMSINGSPVIIDTKLKANEVLMVNKYALGFKKDGQKKKIDQKLGHVDYKGEVFYDVIEAIGKERMWLLKDKTA